ncbi:MAG: response regulator [Verrucomicrobia bacterium]|nr:response regulator [Verrucomicrobiota bacterium]
MSETKPKKKVLFVDDSTEFLQIFSQAMEAHSRGEWEIYTATNAGKALSILEEHPIHLAVVDVQMPLIDGMQLLKLIGNKQPNLPKAVLTGFPNPDDRTASLANGADLYLEKPTAPEGMETIFYTLNELARVESEEGFQGTIRRVGLHDILQMECLGRSSAILEVFNKDTRGEIFIKNGAIIHAQAKELSGQEAFYRLLSIMGGGFKLKPFVAPPRITITISWEHLLMESARLRDETDLLSKEEEDARNGVSSVVQPVIPLRLPKLKPAALKKEPVQITEMAVFSLKGAVLYEWQCPDVELRKRILEFVTEKSTQLAQNMHCGRLDLLEMQSGKNRMVAQLQADAGIYVAISGNPANS